MGRFNQRQFDVAVGRWAIFVQDNHSLSFRGTLRRLHFQLPPEAQGKLVRMMAGEVFDVGLDLRKRSPTFRKWLGFILSAENRQQLWIPEGFAQAEVFE